MTGGGTLTSSDSWKSSLSCSKSSNTLKVRGEKSRGLPGALWRTVGRQGCSALTLGLSLLSLGYKPQMNLALQPESQLASLIPTFFPVV